MRCRVISFSLLTLICAQPVSQAVAATSLEGKVDSTSLEGNASNNFLQGGIKNEAMLNPSLKVIPGQGKNVQLRAETPKYFYPTNAPLRPLTQYHGGTQIGGGGPRLFPQAPSYGHPSVEQYAGGGRVGHPIAPISSYTLMPHNSITTYHGSGSMAISSQQGVSSYVPGYEITKVVTHKGVTAYVPGHEAQQAVSQKGVTSYASSSPTMTAQISSPPFVGFGNARHVPGPAMRDGVISYAPGYSVSSAPVSTHGGISSFFPGHESKTPTTHSGVTEHSPGYQITINTPKNGIVCWDSRYESSIMTHSLEKHTLGGMYYTPERVLPNGQLAKTEELAFKPMFAQPVVDFGARPLRATALGLPGIRPVASTELTWDEWYKRVARAIYGRWQDAEVGPGRATVSVTVTKDRMLAGKVVDFTPASDVERNAAEETAFRQAAIKAVNMVSEFEIPEFPSSADVPSVTFEVDMKREVDGPAGFDVASIPGPKPERSEPVSARAEEIKREEAIPARSD